MVLRAVGGAVGCNASGGVLGIGATVSVANQELQRAGVALKEIETIMASYKIELDGIAPYIQVAQGYISQAQGYGQQIQAVAQAVGVYITTGSAYLQEADSRLKVHAGYLQETAARIQFDNTEVSWLQATLTNYKQDYASGIQMLAGGNVPMPTPRKGAQGE